jgi:tetratricopeptide (TPR) repeat protein
MYKEAIADFEKDTSFYHIDPVPATLGHMGVAYYKAGRISKAEEYLESISKKDEQSPVGSPSFFTAAIYAAMGNNRAALEYLEKAYLENEVEMY